MDKLDTAELCINLKDHKLFSKDADGNVFEVSPDAANPDLTDYSKGDNVSELNNDAGYITVADVGDGKITITDADGKPVGEFTVNQDGNTDITLPAIPVVEDQIHIGDTYPNV